jgi:hypothetical protein
MVALRGKKEEKWIPWAATAAVQEGPWARSSWLGHGGRVLGLLLLRGLAVGAGEH